MIKREWADVAFEALSRGEAVQVCPRGQSMSGRISDGDLVTLKPNQVDLLAVGDIVLVRIQGRCYSHLVLHQVIEREAERFLIGNNHGGIDGWVAADDIFGHVVKVEETLYMSVNTP